MAQPELSDQQRHINSLREWHQRHQQSPGYTGHHILDRASRQAGIVTDRGERILEILHANPGDWCDCGIVSNYQVPASLNAPRFDFSLQHEADLPKNRRRLYARWRRP